MDLSHILRNSWHSLSYRKHAVVKVFEPFQKKSRKINPEIDPGAKNKKKNYLICFECWDLIQKEVNQDLDPLFSKDFSTLRLDYRFLSQNLTLFLLAFQKRLTKVLNFVLVDFLLWIEHLQEGLDSILYKAFH